MSFPYASLTESNACIYFRHQVEVRKSWRRDREDEEVEEWPHAMDTWGLQLSSCGRFVRRLFLFATQQNVGTMCEPKKFLNFSKLLHRKHNGREKLAATAAKPVMQMGWTANRWAVQKCLNPFDRTKTKLKMICAHVRSKQFAAPARTKTSFRVRCVWVLWGFLLALK